jgi:outer membrane protein assembly factor BamB
MHLEKNKNTTPKTLYNIAKRTAIVSVIFALVLSVLMIANYIQTKSVDPLNSKAISQLMLQLQQNPEDEALKEQIRALDLLARKAYFTNQWQIRAGGYLLFAFVLVFLISLKYMSSLQAQLPDLDQNPTSDDSWEKRLLARKYFVFIGLGLFFLAFVLGILSENELSKIGMAQSSEKRTTENFPGINEIRDNWPTFRGPEGIGIAYHTDVPTEWDGKSDKNILWKIRIPMVGYNSPIIWEDKIFLSGADKDSQEVYCINAQTGNMLWRAELNNIPGTPHERPKPTDDTGFAAPTMTTDGERVFVIFATGDIACLDFDGNRIWAKNLGMPKNHYGHSSSLMTYQGLVLVQYDQNSGGHLIALKAATGDLVYDKARDIQISWASPILVNTGKRDEIILNANPDVISYNPLTGEELWRVKCMYGEIAPSPAYADGIVFVVNEYARLAGIKLGDPPEIAWEYDDDLSEVSSPLATKDFLIMAASWGTVSCFDSKTGERYWYHEFDEGFYSSPIMVGDHVYLTDMKGVTQIFKADKEFQLISSCELGESVVATPAFMHNRIYIRGNRHLFCIGS